MGRIKQVSDEAILDAARSVFVDHGFGASTREVALKAGVSEAVLYQRFKSKLNLFFAAMVPPPLQLQSAAEEPDDTSVAADLTRLSTEVMAYFRSAMPIFLQLVTHPSFSLNELVENEPRMPVHHLAQLLTARLQKHQAKGSVRADPAQLQTATLTLLATLHSLALFERMGIHGGSFPDAAVKSIVELVVAGLNPAQGGSR